MQHGGNVSVCAHVLYTYVCVFEMVSLQFGKSIWSGMQSWSALLHAALMQFLCIQAVPCSRDGVKWVWGAELNWPEQCFER